MKKRRAFNRLDEFCSREGIRTADLAEASEVSRKHVTNIRRNKVASPGTNVLARIAEGCSRITKRRVRVTEIYDFVPSARRSAR
jgi:transcriptional regulator with XRE-family HTH domain